MKFDFDENTMMWDNDTVNMKDGDVYNDMYDASFDFYWHEECYESRTYEMLHRACREFWMPSMNLQIYMK